MKLQFPGVSEAIDSDVALLKTVFSGLLRLGGKGGIPLDPLIDEVRTLLKQEVDYLQEAVHLREYRELLDRHDEQPDRYVLPQVLDEFSTGRVLAMSFEPGMKLREWLGTRPSQAERNEFGQMVLDLYDTEFFRMVSVQTDPNYSNFLFRPQNRRLVLLDFGATRRYDTKFRRDYRDLLTAIRGGDREEILRLSYQMELLLPGESEACLDAFLEMLRLSIEPFDPRRQPFVFADRDYAQEVRNATWSFTQKIRKSPPPRSLIFLHRKLGGVFNMLKTMEAVLDLGPHWERLQKFSL